MTSILGRGTRFAAICRKVKIDFPEYGENGGVSIILRELSREQLKSLPEKSLADQLALMIVDESGQLVYTSPEDIENLKDMPHVMSTKLEQEALALNGISKSAVEEAVKNLETSPNGSSESA